MADRPLIVIVDDRPHGLGALRDALERRYAADYQILANTSAVRALDDLAIAKVRGDEVALVIADQWMPEMTGKELLERAHALHPGAQRALLVGWGDTRANETILQGCARGQLDNFILKPWSPPEVHLYPAIG
jgi:thioredoxin reductase (NADPH)